MKIEESGIKYVNFGAVELEFKCEIPKSNQEKIEELGINMTYSIFKAEEQNNLYQIVLHLIISPPEKKPGYRMTVRTFGIFEVPEELDKASVDITLINTCLPMVIGSTRGFISDVSSNFPFGRYHLPAITMNNIVAAQEPVKD
jgi:preprotein translocase subunit SecB